jgi:hypothetical protein
MPTRLAPTCDECGAQANGGGHALDPKTLKPFASRARSPMSRTASAL